MSEEDFVRLMRCPICYPHSQNANLNDQKPKLNANQAQNRDAENDESVASGKSGKSLDSSGTQFEGSQHQQAIENNFKRKVE